MTERKLLEDFYSIGDFASSLPAGSEEDKVWSRLLDKLSVALNAEAATYFTYVPATGYLVPIHAIGPKAGMIKEITVHAKTGVAGWAALHREPVVVEDVGRDPRFLKDVDQVTDFETKTVLVVPVMENLSLQGLVEFVNKGDGPFTKDDLRFAESCCKIVALAVRNLKLASVVEKVAVRNAAILESLTGGFIAVDLHGRVIILNAAARRILRLGPEAKMNIPLEQALPSAPGLARVLLEALSKRQALKRQELPWTVEGRARTIGYSTILLQDPRGEMTGAGITFQDITPQSGEKS